MTKVTLLLCFLFFANYRQKDEEYKIYNIGILQLTVSQNLNFFKQQGIDSYIGGFINENHDTLFIEYGKNKIIYNIYNPLPTIFFTKEKELFKKRLGRYPLPNEALFSDYPQEDEDERIFDKNYYMYDTINGIITKLIQPKKIGNGTTGIFIPKLKDGNSFSCYGIDLDSATNREILSIFKRIRYR